MPNDLCQMVFKQIKDRLGFIPPFFEPAASSPIVLENLWYQTRTAYLDNPIPDLFKEKLAALVSRYCLVPYCLMCHSTTLRPLGMRSSDILEILQQPAMSFDEQASHSALLRAHEGTQGLWPVAESDLENAILHCAVSIFLNQDWHEVSVEIKRVLGQEYYDLLILFIAYNKTALQWAEAHPELSYEADLRVQTNLPSMVNETPELKNFFQNYKIKVKEQEDRRSHWTPQVKARALTEENERDLVDTLEGMSDAFFAVDSQWNFTRVNRNMVLVVGLERDRIIGSNLRDLFFPEGDDYYEDFISNYKKVFEEGVSVNFEALYKPLNIWLKVAAFPKRGGGMSVFFSDITAAKQSQMALIQSEETWRSITDAAPQMIFTTTAKGEVDYINPRWYEYTQKTPEETLGSAYMALIHEDDVENTIKLWTEAVESVVPFEVEHRFRRGDGAYRWFLVRAVPGLIGGELQRFYGSITDVHDQKTFSDQLAKAKDEAERANQTKSFFLANMSHEIRTPLSAILGFAELLKEEDILPLEKFQYLDTITRNGVALTKIIDDILDLAKVESGKLDVEKIDFSFFDLIDDVMDLFRERTRGKGLFFRFHIAKDTPNRIYSDPTRLRQILINIVGNAVKFTEYGGVTIEVSTSHQNDRSLQYRIAVIDTGVGLSAEQRSRLFEPFMQADNSTTRKFGGTGLGLALSQRLAAALGGEITIEDNRILRGSVFIINFLAEIRADESELGRELIKVSQAAAASSGKISGLYVLVADDSPDNLFLAKRILTKNGAKVRTVANGSEAATVALEEHFDVILMDIQMPVMDGYEATRALREAGYARPIIALTAHAMAEERAKSIKAGCNGHLTKPLNQVDLVEGIRNLVNRP